MNKVAPEKRKNKTINAYSTHVDFEIIKMAAQIKDVSVAKFVTRAAIRDAKQVLKEQPTLNQ